MSFRKPLAAVLCLAPAAAAAIALYFSHTFVALAIVASATAGACAALLLRRRAPNEQAVDELRERADGATRESGGLEADGRAAFVPAGELLEAMMSSMREGLVVVDGGMRVVALNAAAREIFGAGGGDAAHSSRDGEDEGRARRAEEAGFVRRGDEPRSLGELTRNPAVLGAFAEALARGRRVEAKVETARGERRAYDLRVAPLKPQGGWGAQRGAVGVFFDITRLERLERVRQEFLSNVSHELRTPLTAIRAFVETLEAGAVDEPAHNRRFLSVIDRNAARMHSLIDDILELSSIEAGRVTVEPQMLRLRPLAQDVLTALGARAVERRVTIINDVPEDVSVFADARRLEQMLTNLVDNAVKFSPEGGEVRVAHERVGDRDRVTVSDAGEGVAPEHLPRIFERFYRVDRARSRALGGTGLGLAIVKHLARAHGGEATVASTPGEGSVFTVELPREENDEV
jgi:two-component system phosphate regulon sensor histidine kinase PhoR